MITVKANGTYNLHPDDTNLSIEADVNVTSLVIRAPINYSIDGKTSITLTGGQWVKLVRDPKGKRFLFKIAGGNFVAGGIQASQVDNFSGNVLGVKLTALTLQNTEIAAGDTILAAFGKLQGQINNGGGGAGKDRRTDWQDPYDYCATAPTGSSTAANVWLIYRIQVAADGTTDVKSASGVAWDNRTTVIYT